MRALSWLPCSEVAALAVTYPSPKAILSAASSVWMRVNAIVPLNSSSRLRTTAPPHSLTVLVDCSGVSESPSSLA